MSDMTRVPVRLEASQDPLTRAIFCPARAYAVDGSLRPCTPLQIEAVGTLFSWTRLGRRCFGQIDLTAGPRVQATLLGEDHEIGAPYALILDGDGQPARGYARV